MYLQYLHNNDPKYKEMEKQYYYVKESIDIEMETFFINKIDELIEIFKLNKVSLY